MLLLGCEEPPPPPVGNHNLLLITLDTVRADFLEPYGFATRLKLFDALAAELASSSAVLSNS